MIQWRRLDRLFETRRVDCCKSGAARMDARPLYLLIAMIFFGAAALAASRWQWGWPVCGFHWLTGWPCPFCGGTRAITRFLQMRWGDALRLNPLVTLGCFFAVGWFGVWMTGRPFHMLESLYRRTNGRWRLAMTAALILLNWVYLSWKSRSG